MSNLEGLRAFIKFFVSNFLFRIAVKILVEVIQFPVKVSGFRAAPHMHQFDYIQHSAKGKTIGTYREKS